MYANLYQIVFSKRQYPSGEGLKQGSASFSVRGQIVNIFGFAGHKLSVETTQLCCYPMKAAIDDM